MTSAFKIYALFALIALIVIGAIFLYNRLIRLRNLVRSSWSDIDVFLKKRHDLAGNLVETVKGYAAHEKTTLTGVTEARSMAMQAQSPAQKGEGENALSAAIKSLFAVAERYPDLKANENFLDLQRQLTDLENDIANSRRYYNAVVRDYNTAIETFPANTISSSLGFSKEEFFRLGSEDEREVTNVRF